MHFLTLISTSLLASLAITAPAPVDISESTMAIAARDAVPMIDVWQDAYVSFPIFPLLSIPYPLYLSPTLSPLPPSLSNTEHGKGIRDWLTKTSDFLGLKLTGSAELEECKNFPSKFVDNITSCKSKKGFRCTIWM